MSDIWDHEADALYSLFWADEPYEGASSYGQAFRKRCKYCGQPELTWAKKEGKWRLYNRKWEIHACTSFRHGNNNTQQGSST